MSFFGPVTNGSPPLFYRHALRARLRQFNTKYGAVRLKLQLLKASYKPARMVPLFPINLLILYPLLFV
jgi:hypothetical protein